MEQIEGFKIFYCNIFTRFSNYVKPLNKLNEFFFGGVAAMIASMKANIGSRNNTK